MRSIKKALLFIPPAFTFKSELDINPLPPLGLGYIAAVLQQQGIEVKIVDALMMGWHTRVDIDNDLIRIGLSFADIHKIILDYGPDMVGINSLFTKQRNNAHEIFRLAKEVNPEIITVSGGAHPTVLPEMVLADKNVDFVVLGEGEDSILDILKIIEGSADNLQLDGIGLKKDGETIIYPKTRYIQDVDSIPFPAWDVMNMDLYFGLGASHGKRLHSRFMPIMTSRGCGAGCTFCSAHRVWGKSYRMRSAENIIEEMRVLKDKYGIKELMFEDDNLTMNVKRAEKIFDLMINENFNFAWDTPNGVAAFALTESIILKMKQSGCYQMNLALESGSQYVLDSIIKKPLKLHKVKPLIEYAKKIKLGVSIYLIIGMPGETLDQIQETFRLAKDMEVYHPHISIATPYPGSELYETCVKNEYISREFNLDDLFIRSFCITTDDWNGEDLKRALKNGRKYLLKAKYKKHPHMLAVDLFPKFLKDPVGFTAKVINFFK
ncbi:MAG: B12-binding domain-containing radical SAM protein [Planctomycetes bacterium]|nr:B12-binding domain-containing radical SAM protein [Planctomycetota bacterium]